MVSSKFEKEVFQFLKFSAFQKSNLLSQVVDLYGIINNYFY